MQSRHLDVDGLRIHLREAGPRDAPPLVLVHGIGVSGTYLVPVGEQLAGGFRVLVPDLPGFGRSEGPRDVPGVRGLAGWLARILGAAGADRPHVLANSLGCQVVLDLAAREPARLGRLVLVGPTVDDRARSLRRIAPRFVLDSAREPPRLLAIIARDYASFGPRRLWRTGRDALRDRPEETARRVAAPTLVVHGERDALTSRRFSALLAERLPDGRLEVVPGHAHAVHYSAPATVARLATAFLRGEERE